MTLPQTLGYIVSVAFMTELTNEPRPRVGSDALSAEWVDMRDVDLAFDHAQISKAKLRQPWAETG